MISTLRQKWKISLLLFLLLATFFIFLFRLGHFALFDYDEATYARVTQESMQRGDILSFQYFGNNWFEKPPLYFWLAMASVKIFGFNEFALRLPSALSGVLAVLLVWLMTWYLTKRYWTAFFASAILLFTGEFVFASRQFRTDVPVTASILAAVYFFIRGWDERKWYLGFGMVLATGVLFKNIIGFFALPIAFIFCLVYKKWDWLKNSYFWMGTALAVVLVAPWHIYESIKFGKTFWEIYAGYHLFQRFIRPIVGGGVSTWSYIVFLFRFAEPWIVVFIIAVIWLFLKYKGRIYRGDKLSLASLGAILFIFLTFAVARTKIFYYLEPVYPFMAMFLASTAVLFYESIAPSIKKSISISKTDIKAGLIFLTVILFSWGAASTFWQSFGDRIGQYAIAAEEKKVGQYIASQHDSQKIYTLNWLWLETVRFYSEKTIAQADESKIEAGSFYLIMPTDLIKLYNPSKEFQKRARLIFQGENISLYQFEKKFLQ